MWACGCGEEGAAASERPSLATSSWPSIVFSPFSTPPRRSFPAVQLAAELTGSLPPDVHLHDLMSWPQASARRSGPEERYLVAYAGALREAYTGNDGNPNLVAADVETFQISAVDAVAAHESQVKFLRAVYAYKADSDEAPRATTSAG